MDEKRFQKFLKEVYAEKTREVDRIPASDEPRYVVSLNRKWRFCRQRDGHRSLGSFERDASLGSRIEPRFRKAHLPGYEDGDWERVHIPHTWNAEDTEDTGPGYWRGIGWYRKRFRLSRKLKGRVLRLRIGGANQRAVLWLNGKKLGRHKGGYSGFELDISKHALFGKRQNVLCARVDNLYDPDVAPTVKTDINWYGGIYRDVEIIATGKPYLKTAHVRTEGVETGRAVLHIDHALSHKTPRASIEATLLDAEGQAVLGFGGTSSRTRETLTSPVVEAPELWSCDRPYLYTLKLDVVSGGTITDSRDIPVGFRWFTFDPDRGFSLNGVTMKLQGTCWHQFYPGLGSALPRSRHRKDMEEMKRMGVNFLRTSHYPHHDEILDAADELGIMVNEEFPVNKEIGNPRAYKKNILSRIDEVIDHHFNHPSLIIWGLGGEVNAPFEISYDISKSCAERFRELDPTRPICMHAPRGQAIGELFDVAGYGLSGAEQTDVEGTAAHREHARSPELAIMSLEYSMALTARGHYGSDEHSEEYGCERHEDYLRRIYREPWYAGGAIWHQFDYHGDTYDRVIPRVVAWGIQDPWRIPKESFFLHKCQWNPEPMVHILGHWNWPGLGESADPAGSTRTVKVYANGRSVDLFLNDVAIGRAEKDEDDLLPHPPFVFKVPYEPGELKAVAHFDDGDPIETTVHTAGEPYRLELSADYEQQVYTDYDALSEITLRVLDREGHLVPTASIPVTFYHTGVGELLDQCWPPFGRGRSWYTVAGLTRILYRPNGLPGSAWIKAYSPGLLQGGLTIRNVVPGESDFYSVDFMQFREFPHGD